MGVAISDLTLVTPALADVVPLDHGGVTKSASLQDILSLLGKPLVKPGPSSGMTWSNQGSSTVHDVTGGVTLDSSADSDGILHSVWYPDVVPAAPYTVTFHAKYFQEAVGFAYTGVCITDGTQFETIAFYTDKIEINQWSSYGGVSSTMVNVDNFTIPADGVWWRIKDDGTTRYFQMSIDGDYFLTLYSEATGTFLTPTGAGIWHRAYGGWQLITLDSLEITTP